MEVRFPAVKRRGPLPVCVVYDAKGKEVERQILSVDAPLTLPAAGSPYYLLTFNVGSATFSVEVKGAAWAVEGRMSDEGLHLLGAAPPLYFEVPEGVKTFHLWLAAGPPGETAVATLTTPAGRVAARFDCTQKQIDDQRVEAQAGEAGFWKLTIEKAPTGVLDDVYVKPGKELPGYFSFAPEQALSVRPE